MSAKALPEHWIEARASRAVDPVTGAIQAYVITLDMWLEFKAALAHERRIRDDIRKGDER